MLDSAEFQTFGSAAAASAGGRVDPVAASDAAGEQAFADGVFLVELAPLSDPALVASSIAQVLGVRNSGRRMVAEGLQNYLRHRHILLLLDNFEHVVEAAPVVADLLATSPGLKVLATSREPLRVRGEREYEVTPLALPTTRHLPPPSVLAQNAAVALFIERAAAIRSGFALTEENAEAIAEICVRLDGLPLAIELAAARVRTLTPQTMVQRVGRRLPLLTGGARDLLARQQTLRDTIDWSYDLLDEDERRLFQRLAVFIGGCTLEAAEAVCDPDGTLGLDVLDGMTSLATQSLLRQVEGPDGEPRFGMLETIREFGLEQLETSGEAMEIRRAHATYFLTLVEDIESNLLGREQRIRFQRLTTEIDNLRAILGRSLNGEIGADAGLHVAGRLWWFWGLRSFAGEGRGWIEALLALPDASAYTSARAWALQSASIDACLQADYLTAASFARESAAIFRDAGDLQGAARSLGQEGTALTALGDLAGARSVLEESELHARAVGDGWCLAFTLNALGAEARHRGDFATARTYYEESTAVARAIGDRHTPGLTLAGLAYIARAEGDLAELADLWRQALAASSDFGDYWLLPRAVAGVAGAAVLAGEPERAASLFGFAEAFRESNGTREMPVWQVVVDRDVAAVREALGDQAFRAVWAEGRVMTLEQAVDFALEPPAPT